ncbi:MAG TPA: integration host factor subunit beta [Porphyromonadaceae bacterium]|nr:integration host factor subunit beta [Porphyromonadaceae bacterium]
MTRADVVSEISKQTGIDKETVLRTLESFMAVTMKRMSEGENIYFRGFGSFILKKRAEKVARNIRKGTSVVVPEHYIPAFKPVKDFVLSVSEGTKKDILPGVEK